MLQLKFWSVSLTLWIFVSFSPRGSHSIETHCIYNGSNLCSNCTASYHVSNMSAIPRKNEMKYTFCSPVLQLDRNLSVQNVENVGIFGKPGLSVLLVCKLDAAVGIVLSNVTNATIESLNMSGCGLLTRHTKLSSYKMGLKKSSIFISDSHNVTIHKVNVSHGEGSGLAIVNATGTIKVKKSVFENNGVPQGHTAGGGGLYMGIFSKNTSYTISECLFKNNNASTVKRRYRDNRNELEHRNPEYSEGGEGGGLSIILTKRAAGNTINVTQSNFTSNTALWGGGMHVRFMGSVKANQIQIIEVNFCNNSSPQNGGGGISVEFVSPADYLPGNKKRVQNNAVYMDNCQFISNNASFGGGITVYATSPKDFSHSSNAMTFHNCTWRGNTARIGAAVDLSSHIWNEEKGSLPVMTFDNCSFLDNSILDLRQEDGKSVSYTKGKGVFYSVTYSVDFSNRTTFSSNTGSALYLISSVARFLTGSNVKFLDNIGLSGGAITMLGFSSISMQDNLRLKFINNNAVDKGGAIMAATINKKDLIDTRACFVEYSGTNNDTKSRNIEVFFANNSAGSFGRFSEVEGHYGHSIFVTSFKPCQNQCHQQVNGSQKVLSCIAQFEFENQVKYDLSTSAVQIKLSPNVTMPLTVIPGKPTRIPINATDEFLNEIANLYHVYVTNTNRSDVTIDQSDVYISDRIIRFFGKPGHIANVTMETIDFREIGITFTIRICDCSPGYVLVTREDLVTNKETHTCICSASTIKKRYPGINRCNDTEFVALLTKGYWIGFDQPNVSTETNLLAGYCPIGYCSTNTEAEEGEKEFKLPPKPTSASLSKFICAENRSGILCGNCKANHTSYYRSSKNTCKEAKRCHWGWLFYILSEIVPITLVFVAIMVFKIKLTTGAFNAFLFFAQVSSTMLVTANGFIIFPYQTFTFVQINKLIYRMFSLSFFDMGGLSFCLWDSAQTLDLLLFKYVSIAYALVLVFIIIAFMKFCNCSSKYKVLSKLHRKKVNARSTIIHGLTGFFVMCYSECTRTSLLLLTPVLLQTRSQKGNSYVRQAVFYNGELEFFKGTHLLYAIPATIVVIVLGIIPPLLLISYPLCYRVFALLRISETKFVRLLCKCIPLESLRPLFDSFQSTFRDNCRFFAGLYFIYRLTLLCSFSFLHNLNEFYLAAQAQFTFILAVHLIVQPYKNRWHNVVDGLIFMLLALINAMTLFNYKHTSELLDYGDVIAATSKVQTTLLYLPLLYMALYCAVVMHQKWKFKKILRKIKVKSQPKTEESLDNMMSPMVIGIEDSSDDLLNSVYHNRKLEESGNGSF